jgi:N-acetylglucosaminyldiphosphoundecaprenol N-acetyl-beta-D-mannosaminyltransferase
MKLNSYNILGVPVQNFNLGTASEKILSLFNSHENGSPPYYVATLNTENITNVHGWGFVQPQNSELLKVLRESQFTTVDDYPLIILSRLLGNPLNLRISEADLISELLELMHAKNLSVYVLGGEQASTQLAVEILQQKYPGLKVCGVDCSIIYTTGSRLIESPERDALILEQINKARPDLLLICLGNPKQEIFFSRVRNDLRASVAIGIGETLNSIAGLVKKAPPQFQKWGLQWLWRILQDPGKLLWKYLHDGIKLLWLGIPLIIYHHLNHLGARFLTKKNANSEQNRLFISSHGSIGVIQIPKFLTKESLGSLDTDLSNTAEQDAIILDMRQTIHIDLLGIAFLIEAWVWAKEKKKKIYLLGLRSNVTILLKLHKTWDLFQDNSIDSPQEIVNQFNSCSFYEAISQQGEEIQVSFFGQLNQQINFEEYFYRLTPMLQQKNCILDFNFCTYIDQITISFLLKIRQLIKSQKKQIKLTGINKNVKNQLKAAKVYQLFNS